MNKITNHLIRTGYLKTDLLIEAFADIPRDEFVPEQLRSVAHVDMPLPIGAGHMMPSMSVLAFMLELLQPGRSMRVLILGHGSGWITAMMSYIVGRDGQVTSIGMSKVLAKKALINTSKFHFIQRDHLVDFQTVAHCDDVQISGGYDRIIVLTPELIACHPVEFLSTGGKMVYPKENIISLINKGAQGEIEAESFAGMQYLPQ